MKFLDRYYIEKWGINDYVEHRLCHWARWYSQHDMHHLGYPQECLESRHLNSGGVIHTNRGMIKPLPCNPAAEEMEAIINRLKQVDDKVANALCQDYLYKSEQALKGKRSIISSVAIFYEKFLASTRRLTTRVFGSKFIL